METLVVGLSVAVYYTLMVLAILWVFTRKRDAASAISWSMAILFLPILGLSVFLLFGRDSLPFRLKGKLRHRPEFARRMAQFIPARGPGDTSRAGFQGIGRLAEQIGNAPIREGNKVSGLLEGREAYESIREAITAARHHIHIEEYIFRDDSLGRELLEMLCARAREGVQVRLLVDAVGTGAARKLIRDLVRASGEGAVFLPMFPFGKTLTPNLRNHRKIIVCDGRVGFMGGMNVGDEYFGLKFRNRYWCDWHVRIEGPAVQDLQRVFLEDWDFAKGEALSVAEYFPPPQDCGDSRVQIIHSGPDESVNSTRQVFFAGITRAQHTIGISSPYFVPDAPIREALRNAALRGVRVQVLTQGWPPENLMTYFASRFHWEELLHAGVRIYQHDAKVLHGKGMIIDSEWAAIGSANMDPRSMQLNFEVLGLLDTPSDAAYCQEHLDRLIGESHEVTLADFNRRGLAPRVAESALRLLSPIL